MLTILCLTKIRIHSDALQCIKKESELRARKLKKHPKLKKTFRGHILNVIAKQQHSFSLYNSKFELKVQIQSSNGKQQLSNFDE